MPTNTGDHVTRTVIATHREGMEAFDDLPQPFRVFLANCPYKYSAKSVHQLIARYGMDRAFQIIVRDKNRQSVEEIKHAYGPDHPQLEKDK